MLLVTMASVMAEDAPRGIQVVEPPAEKREAAERATSSSGQFTITGGQTNDRATASLLAEQAKNELLDQTGEKQVVDAKKYEWKVPMAVIFHGKPGDAMPARTIATQILVGESGYRIQLDVHLCRGIEQERFKAAVTGAFLIERALKSEAGKASDTRFLVPPWLVDGLREATAWRLNESDRRLYEALYKTGGLFKIDDLLAVDEPSFEDLDGATRAAFRVSSGSLVMALLEQPRGKEGFRNFLTEAAAFEGEMPALLRRHFPELNLSETSLAKWWALQMANIGGKNLTTDVLTVGQTETALAEALRLNIRSPEGVLQQKELSSWPEIAKLPQPERVEAVSSAQDALVRLSYRCFPTYRPILSEYQLVLGEISKNQIEGIVSQLAKLSEQRTTLTAKAQRARDYLDWFEITRARQTSGVFDDYMRLKDRLKANPRRRNDDLSNYLDRLDALFHRPGMPTTAPAQAGEIDGLPPMGDLPELPTDLAPKRK